MKIGNNLQTLCVFVFVHSKNVLAENSSWYFVGQTSDLDFYSPELFNAKYWNFYIDYFFLQELKGKQWQLANYFEIHKSLAFHVEKSYFASIIRVTRLSNTRHSLIINPWAWITRFRQFTIIEPTSIIKLHISIYWQKTWI